jgi:hypothetical protein
MKTVEEGGFIFILPISGRGEVRKYPKYMTTVIYLGLTSVLFAVRLRQNGTDSRRRS